MKREPAAALRRCWVQARTAVTHSLANAFFQSLSRAGRLHPLSRPELHGVRVVYDVAYVSSAHAEHRLDVYRPAYAEGPLPAVLYLHGGGFRMLSKETHWVMGLLFARAGYVVFNISYRLAPRFPFPAAVEDACDAFGWLVRNAPAYQVDSSRIVVAGESAGANLAAAVCVASCYPRAEPYAQRTYATGVVPCAMVLGCGVLQVSDPGRFARRKRLSAFVRGALEDIHRDYVGQVDGDTELADPLLVLEGAQLPARALPPCFAFVGTRDPLLDDTRRLGRALERLGVAHETRFYPGQLHAFHALPLLPAARAAWRDTYQFLAPYTRAQPPGRR